LPPPIHKMRKPHLLLQDTAEIVTVFCSFELWRLSGAYLDGTYDQKGAFSIGKLKNFLMAKALKSPVHYLLLWWAAAGDPLLEQSVCSYPVSTENLRNLRNTSSAHYFFLFLKELCISASSSVSSSGLWYLQARNSVHLTERTGYCGRGAT